MAMGGDMKPSTGDTGMRIFDPDEENPYRVPKKLPGISRLEDFIHDGKIFLTVMLMGLMFILGLIVGVIARG